MLGSQRFFIVGYLLWWLFWTLVQTLVLHRLGQSWDVSLIDALVSNFLLGTLSLSALMLFRFYQPGGQLRIYRFLYALLIALIYCYVLQLVLGHFLAEDQAYIRFLDQSMPLRFIIGLLILSFIAILNWMYTLLQQQKEQEKRRNESEQLVKDAELFRLRQQLQPHFLFNSLNSISALAGSEPERARDMIQKLSDFLRGTVRKEKEKFVEFKEEISHLSLYLEIEKVRFGNRLRFQMNVDRSAESAMIPPLLLQPLVENAVKFAVYGTLDQVLIGLSAEKKAGTLEVILTNPFDPEQETENRGTGFGLTSLHRRLLLIYGRADLLKTEIRNGTFICKLQIPQ